VHPRDLVPAQQFAVDIPQRVTNQREPIADDRQPLAGAQHVHRPGPESLGRPDAVWHGLRLPVGFGEPRSYPVRER
jgi:hypothetical protein